MSTVPGRLAAAAVLAQTVLLQLLFVAVFGLLADEDPFSGNARDIVGVATIHTIDAALVVGALLVAFGGRSLGDLGWSAEERPVRAAVLGVAGAALGVSLIVAVGALLGGVDGVRETVAGFVGLTPGQRVLMATIGLGAAFVEETVFRGTLQPALVARLGRPAGIAVGAVIFSAYHLRFGPVGFLVKAIFGAIFGTLRESTDRNWAGAVAHAGIWLVVGLS
ncbi:MAG: CPBP family intramembrane metalloprotease [Alphaproteobacteria bacterium]|nr:CPBP family intramembrane metalloprotease [Alphaproteobacteria bacterium]MCB9695296.1 CPBP family intramembrane metalloprotease [Alphaproteobacteria bacterium]